MTEVLVEVDERRRIGLGRVGAAEHERYLARREPDGTIVLTPAVVMSGLQAQLLSNPQLVDRIEAVAGDPARAVRRPRPQRRDV